MCHFEGLKQSNSSEELSKKHKENQNSINYVAGIL